jgi:hypothetical protein
VLELLRVVRVLSGEGLPGQRDEKAGPEKEGEAVLEEAASHSTVRPTPIQSASPPAISTQ